MLGFWLVYQATSPWAGSVLEIRRFEREGPQYYKADGTSADLDARVRTATAAIRQRQYDRATDGLQIARRLDPRNPLLDYLSAAIAYRQHRVPEALELIAAGNRKGTLRVYVNSHAAPDSWYWPETRVVAYLARNLLRDMPTDRRVLDLLLAMSEKLIWSEPPDAFRLLQAVELRQTAAKHLKAIAVKEGDTRLAKLCDRLIEEATRVRYAEERHVVGMQKALTEESRAWVMARAVGHDAPGSRRLLMLYMLEKRAQWADQLRRNYVRIRTNTTLEI